MKIKKMITAIAILLLVTMLFGCSSDSATAKTPSETAPKEDPTAPLVADSWKGLNDGDEYIFNADGTGTHNGTAITYTIDGETVQITEGVASTVAKNFVLNTTDSPAKLIPEGENTFYVQSKDYEEISAKLREENTAILTSHEFWSATKSTAYLQFTEAGGGWLIMVGNTLAIEWEFVDNNTIKAVVNFNGSNQTLTLNIINNAGDHSLVTPDGSATYVPKV